MAAANKENADTQNVPISSNTDAKTTTSASVMPRNSADTITAVVPKSSFLTHKVLDRSLAALLVAAAFKFGNPKAFLKTCTEATWLTIGPKAFNWKKNPMNKFVAVATWLTGVYFLIKTYVVERGVVQQAHKKYAAHNNKLAVALHGAGSSLEISLGCLACCYPKKTIFTKIASALAINNILTGFVLTPGVFGIKHLTVPGFYLFGFLRALEIVRTLAFDYTNYPQAWILLQVGTVVRLLGYFVLPYSSTDGTRGDLFTEPTIYSFNILLSGYLTSAFVYPPKWVLSSLLFYVAWYNKQPPRISMRRRLHYDGVDESRTSKGMIRGASETKLNLLDASAAA
jgi:hypothetical protein